MYMNSIIKHIGLIFVIALVCCGCANEVAPTGGPKDVTPPKVLSSSPAIFSTNFNSDLIQITFDEFFQLNNYKQKVIVSPPLKHDPLFIVKGKTLIIKLKDPLLLDRTYKIFMDDAVVDYHEGNPYKDFSYVFSTGNTVDSLYVKGTVKDAFTLSPIEGALVCLYDDLSDSAFISNDPLYITKTDKNGKFHIDYIKDTLYHIFAIVNMDNKLNFSLPTEKIAFLQNVVNPQDTVHYIDLLLFNEEDTVQRVVDSKSVLNEATFVYKFPPVKPEIKFINNVPEYYSVSFNNTCDTVHILTYGIDTLSFVAYDNDIVIDTLQLVVSSQKMIDKAILTVSQTAGNKLFYASFPTLHFNNIIKSIIVDSVMTIVSKDKESDTTYCKLLLDKHDNIAKIDCELQKKSNYDVFIPDSSFIDVNGHYNKKFTWKFDVADEDDYGGIVIKLVQDSLNNCNTISCIVQLLDEKDNVRFGDKVITLNNHDTVTLNYPLLTEGKYKFRIIHDINEDGKRTSGNYLQHKQPESVIISKIIEVKKKWDVEETVNINYSLDTSSN